MMLFHFCKTTFMTPIQCGDWDARADGGRMCDQQIYSPLHFPRVSDLIPTLSHAKLHFASAMRSQV